MLNIPALLGELASNQIELVRGYRKRAEFDYDAEMIELAKLAEQASADVDDLAEDAALLDQFAQLRDELAIVALYRVVELDSKTALRWYYSSEDIERRRLFQYDKMSKALKADLRVDVKELTRHDDIRQLRLANNAVKHEGKVSSKLSKHSAWAEGEPIRITDGDFERWASAIPVYLRALSAAIVPHNKRWGKIAGA